ncbi:MAG: stage II sporulation protein M [Conexivisphaerales archaeon]
MSSLSAKAVSFDDSLSRCYWTWRKNPATSVPTMLNSSLSIMVQAIFSIFGIMLLVKMQSDGILTQLLASLLNSDYQGLLRLVEEPFILNTLLSYLTPAIILSVIIFFLAAGFVYSAEYSSYVIALSGDNVKVETVMSRIRYKWRSMAWTHFLSSLISLGPIVIGTAVLLYTLAIQSFTVVGVSIFLLSIIPTCILSFSLIYTEIAVIKDGLTGLSAIRRSFNTVKRNWKISLTYALADLFLSGLFISAASLIPGAGLPLSSLVSIAVSFIVIPIMHLTKTSIYSDVADGKLESSYVIIYPSLLADVVKGLPTFLLHKFIAGLSALKSFIVGRNNIFYHLTSLLALIIGLAAGLEFGYSGFANDLLNAGYVPGRINPLVSSSIPVSLGLYIFLHNWQVSLATALSGIWFSVTPFVSIFVNGFILGSVYTLVPNFFMFAAAILPHGVIELPSFILAGSAGIRLGVFFYKFNKANDDKMNSEFYYVARQTIYLLIALALLFLIAGLIEANITPIIMHYAGWT